MCSLQNFDKKVSFKPNSKTIGAKRWWSPKQGRNSKQPSRNPLRTLRRQGWGLYLNARRCRTYTTKFPGDDLVSHCHRRPEKNLRVLPNTPPEDRRKKTKRIGWHGTWNNVCELCQEISIHGDEPAETNGWPQGQDSRYSKDPRLGQVLEAKKGMLFECFHQLRKGLFLPRASVFLTRNAGRTRAYRDDVRTQRYPLHPRKHPRHGRSLHLARSMKETLTLTCRISNANIIRRQTSCSPIL